MAEVKAKGLVEATEYLKALEQRLGDMEAALEVVASDLELMVSDAFENEASPTGKAWTPLSPVTVKLRPKRKGGQILSDRGLLQRSVKSRVTDFSALIGTNNKYAKAQQFGNPDNKIFGKYDAPIPARPFLPVDKNGKTTISKEKLAYFRSVILKYITKGRNK